MSKRILLVEHDSQLKELYEDVLKKANFEVKSSRSAQDSVELLDDWRADAAVVDVGLPGHGGWEVVHELLSYDDWQNIPIILLTNTDRDQFQLGESQWQEYGIVDVLYKPNTTPRLLAEALKGFFR